MSKMKAMVYQEYGPPDNLALLEVPKPSPMNGEVLIKTKAASLNWIDWHFLSGSPWMVRVMAGLIRPTHHILGIDLAGIVEDVGQDISRFSPGDEVFGTTDHGCFAEYACVKEAGLVLKPSPYTFEEAAAVPAAASVAMQGLLKAGKIRAGQKVLINGASGGVGSFAVQLAKHFNARVTGVCSGGNRELVRSLGADQVIDYTQEIFTSLPERYDLIFDVAAKSTFSDCRRVLKSGGVYLTTAFSPGLQLWSLIQSTGNNKMIPLSPTPPTQDVLLRLKTYLNQGVFSPIIEKQFPLAELPNALRYLSQGHARGKIVIRI